MPSNPDNNESWHTCHQCEHITLYNIRNTSRRTEISATQALEGALHGCLFFAWLLKQSSLKVKLDFNHLDSSPTITVGDGDGLVERSVTSLDRMHGLIQEDCFVLEADCEEQHISIVEQSLRKSSNDCEELVMMPASSDPACLHLANIDDKPVRVDGASDEMLNLARDWLNECLNSHEDCTSLSVTSPSRLVEIKTDPLKVHLHDVEPTHGHPKHAALSYCWGGAQAFATTRARLSQYKDEIPLDTIGRTIYDACVVTQKLGFKYIWVDSLCIVQDDPEDVSREIGKMAQIYQGAAICISASRALSSKAGFLQERKIEECVQNTFLLQYVCDGEDVHKKHVVVAGWEWWYSPKMQPIDHRAWTLQEHLLPTRVLRFHDHQLLWTCNSNKISDGGFIPADDDPGAVDRLLPPIDKEKADLIEHWADIVYTYTQRLLTYPGDKLKAIGGIAEAYGHLLQGNYLAGLWNCDGVDLGNQLLWEPEGKLQGGQGARRTDKYRAPSWSWASIDGAIGFHPHVGTTSVCGIISCEVELEHKAVPYGAVRRACLNIRGTIQVAEWVKRPSTLRISSLLGNGESSKKRKIVQEIPFVPDDSRESSSQGEEWVSDEGKARNELQSAEEVYCLKVGYYDDDGTYAGLILRSVTEGKFQRIGVCYELPDMVNDERTIELI